MEELLKKSFDLKKTEFWFATVLYVFAIFFLVSRAISPRSFAGMATWEFDEVRVLYSYYSNYFIPKLVRYTTLYGTFVLMMLVVVPNLLAKRKLALNITFTIAIFLAVGVIFFITDTWLRAYLIAKYRDLEHFYNALFKENMLYAFWLMMMFAFYCVIKSAASYILLNTDKIPARHQATSRECAVALVIWMIIMLLLMGSYAPREIIGIWGMVIPFGIGLYWYSFYELIPNSFNQKKGWRKYFFKIILLILMGSVLLFGVGLILFEEGDDAGVIVLFNVAFQLVITAPLAWLVYKRRLSANAEIYQLKTELGRSNAGLDFLRSQINPHFLFNSLNTLYGTALQENSDRTANGIQKLGDMMRFMLHENHQDSILLSREIDYMRNYIDLQLLRTQSSPDIRVETKIEDSLGSKKIAPMLLIPFVENAFKHGISLAEPSYINITLFSNEKELYFDVYNSIHPRNGDDPEKEHSGIGLENVKQRLRLVYPNRHKLIIRETAKEFFIHLTVEF